MKKLLLILSCAVLMSGAAFGQANSFRTNASNYNIPSATSSAFDVTFSLNTTVSSFSSWDLFLRSNSANANDFTISTTTSSIANTTPASNAQAGDTFATDPNFSDATFVNGHDQGFSTASDQTISGGSIQLETMHITFAAGSAPTVGTQWTFSTTGSGTTGSPAKYKGSYFYTNNLGTWNPASAATFTVTVVPEPATLSLLGLGGLGSIGLTLLRSHGARG